MLAAGRFLQKDPYNLIEQSPELKNKCFQSSMNKKSTCSTVECQLSKLMWGRGVWIIKKYIKSNTHTFIHRALLNYYNKAYTS